MKTNKQILLRKLRRLSIVWCLKCKYEDKWNFAVCLDWFFQKDCSSMTNNGMGTNAREEILTDTRMLKMNERITTCSSVFSFITFRLLQNNKVEKNVSHISNVPKWANWIKPVLVVAKNAASRPVFSSLSLFPSE